MKQSTIEWHLARDSQEQLARFCEANKVSSVSSPNTYNDGEHSYFQIQYIFDNGSYITAELLHGDTKSYTVADHFQVVDYALNN